MVNAEPADDLGQAISLNPADIPFANDGLNAPTLYVDVIRGASVMGEVSKLSMVEHRMNSLTNGPMAFHVANVVIPTSQIRAWADYLTKLADAIGLPKSNDK